MKSLLRNLLTATEIAFSLFAAAITGQAQTLPGTVTSSWIGNSFMSVEGNQWVPDNVSDLCVTPDGIVFTAGYAESGGGGAEYKNGKLVARYSGFDSGFGDPTAVVATEGTNVYWGDGNGIQVYGFGGGSAPKSSFLKGASVLGLAVRGGQLFLSDFNSGLIRVYDLKTQTEVRRWKMERPGKMALDKSGRLWVIQYAAGSKPGDGVLTGERILSFSGDGKPGPVIADVTNPLALTVNGKNQLLVGGLDRAGQIRVYGNLGGTPVLVQKIGAAGGILAGTPGAAGPWRFHFIKGLATDAAGSLYVTSCNGGIVWGQSVEAYSAAHKRLWQIIGSDYCDLAGIDLAHETDAYDIYHHYTLDYSKSGGKDGTLKGYTLNRFKYPQDPRPLTLNGPVFRQTFGVRRLQGRLFLLCSTQNGYRLEMFRFSPRTDGETAIPSVVINGGSENFIARDANANGQFDPGEAVPGIKDYWKAGFDVTDDGDIFMIGDASGPATLIEYPMQGLDGAGNPIYTAASVKTWKAPAEMGSVRGSIYDKPADVMYLAGWPKSENNGGFVQIARYDGWSHSPKLVWLSLLPNNDASYTPNTSYGGGTPAVLRAAGKYLFAAYGYGYVRVLDKADGHYVGTIKPSVGGFSGGGGQIDGVYAMTATLLRSGEYVILEEDAGHNHVVEARWRP